MKIPQQPRNLILILLAVNMLIACQPQQAEQPANQQAPAPQISVAKVIYERITEWDEFTGHLAAPQKVELRPRVSGYIDNVAFMEGQLVTAGDVLFLVDSKQLQAQVNRLKSDVVDAESQELLARKDLKRGRQLKNQNAISQEELENRIAHQQQTKAVVQSRKSSLVQALLDLDYAQVKSPISGRTSRAMITKGNYVSKGLSLLTTIVSTDKIYAYFDADEQSYLKYNRLAAKEQRPNYRQSKAPVLMGLIDDDGFPHVGHIDFMDNQVNMQTGTITGRAVFENTKGYFTPGLFARIKVASNTSYRSILIDDKAIGTDLQNKFVLVLDKENKVQYHAVTLGKKHNGLRLIKNGLKPNDIIVTKGLQRVRPGSLVIPTTINMASDQVLAQLKSQQQRIDAFQTEMAITHDGLSLDNRG